MDDVTFGHSGPYVASGIATPWQSLTSINVLFWYVGASSEYLGASVIAEILRLKEQKCTSVSALAVTSEGLDLQNSFSIGRYTPEYTGQGRVSKSSGLLTRKLFRVA